MMNSDWKTGLLKEVKFKAEKSQGPGGQNVNKVSSAAVLYWDPSKTRLFSDLQKNRILQKMVDLDSGKNLVVLRSQKFRDLPANKRACIEKLAVQIGAAIKPAKTRKKT